MHPAPLLRLSPLLLALLGTPSLAQTPLLAPPPTTANATGSSPDIRVQLSASRHTVISSELAGKITQLEVKEGEHFKQGERLVSFDCAVHQARLNHSTAAEAAASKKLEVARRLNQLQSISLSEIDQAQAALTMARAESGVGRVMVQRCSITAPFSGRVAERKVQPGEYVAEGEKLLDIYDDSAFDVELIVPSRWLTWLKPDHPFSVSLDETGQSYPAKVVRVGSVVDPLSQSIKVFGRLTRVDSQLLPGMSGVATLSEQPAVSTP